VGSITDGFSVKEGTSGLVTSLELAMIGIAGIFIASRMHKLHTRRYISLSYSVAVLGNMASVWCLSGGHFQIFVFVRMLTGLCEGICFAVSVGMAARTELPERTYAILATCEVLLGGIAMFGIATMAEKMWPVGTYVSLVGVQLIIMPFITWFPENVQTSTSGGLEKFTFNRISIRLLGCYIFLIGGITIIWVFVERIGISNGLTFEQISWALVVAQLVCVVGPVACAFCCKYFGRTYPILLGIAFQIGVYFVLVFSGSFYWWVFALIFSATALFYFLPLFSGLLAHYDPSGGMNAASTAFNPFATCLGPLVGGMILNFGGSYVTLLWISVISFLITMAMVYSPSKKADERRTCGVEGLGSLQKGTAS
jgi:predicted MFS family arabinose efflux permease